MTDQSQPLVAIAVGVAAAAIVAGAFLRHQWATWMRVAKAVPMVLD